MGLASMSISTPASSAPVDINAVGKQISTKYCNACHLTGVIGAPRIGKKADWEFRLQRGYDQLIQNALKGFRNMPAKGGNLTLTDEEIIYAVTYMLETAQLDQGGTGENTGAEVGSVAAQKPGEVETATSPTRQTSKEVKGDTASDSPALTPPTRAKVSRANQFNRLLKGREEWNPSPFEDGIHDPENSSTYDLQGPMEAFEFLKKNPYGNHVDWVHALQNGMINPRFDLNDPDESPVLMDLDIVREVKGSMPDVVYPHTEHTEWLDCANCHPSIFVPQKGANTMSMASILMGQQCGVCHGKVAFPISECARCHSKKSESNDQ
jgi:c(7)-type cytochrome triheme protein